MGYLHCAESSLRLVCLRNDNDSDDSLLIELGNNYQANHFTTGGVGLVPSIQAIPVSELRRCFGRVERPFESILKVEGGRFHQITTIFHTDTRTRCAILGSGTSISEFRNNELTTGAGEREHDSAGQRLVSASSRHSVRCASLDDKPVRCTQELIRR
jgi:hypothetical protein